MSSVTNGNGEIKSRSFRNKHEDVAAAPLSNSALEAKAKQLQLDSAKLSATLTQKLATSQSGQNLLHMGTSLSSLPPDLHSLLQNLHPVLSATEITEKSVAGQVEKVVSGKKEIYKQQWRSRAALAAAETYQDLVAAELTVARDLQSRRYGTPIKHESNGGEEEDETYDELDQAAALERAAGVTVLLMGELQAANESLPTALATHQDTEHEQFLVKLVPRIRRLDADLAQCLRHRMELLLNQLQQAHNQQPPIAENSDVHQQDKLLVVLGHVMRGLAVTGRSKDVESIFARSAVTPIVRTKLSMGRLDEGGSRGECAGLTNLLNELVNEIAEAYSPVLAAAEAMFAVRNSDGGVTMDVDLLTSGVWVPIATALMADAGIKMSIFSPGIASVLQTNYMALDTFLSALAGRLLLTSGDDSSSQEKKPAVAPERVQQAQDRIYAHPKTSEFTKKWNLPIYYQLRFGECCTRLNKAIDQTKLEGWAANVYSGAEEQGAVLRQNVGFELSLFIELYDTILGLWLPDVILLPLTNRFLRGAVQLVGRVLSFIDDGMDGKLLFGEEPAHEDDNLEVTENGTGSNPSQPVAPPPPTRKPYCWGESEQDVAAVAWELAILESTICHDYATIVCTAVSPKNTMTDDTSLRDLVLTFLKEASDQILPIIDKAWNLVIVDLLTQKCSGPLAAVKGVAATYRMTNRPPPKQASPFVWTILRPLKEFDLEFANRIPNGVGSSWKQQVVVTVADRYAAAVDDLIATVQRTEVALKNRKARRTLASGMSDGEKVKLQLYLDSQAFTTSILEVGIEPATVIGLSKLRELTAEGEKLLKQAENGM